jgi:hypothetical protein
VLALVVGFFVARGAAVDSHLAATPRAAPNARSPLDDVRRAQGAGAPHTTRGSQFSTQQSLNTSAGFSFLHRTQAVGSRTGGTELLPFAQPPPVEAASEPTLADSGAGASPPPGPPIEIYDVHAERAPFNAEVTWETSEATSSLVAYGIDRPTLWTASSDGKAHTAALSGLALQQPYKVWVMARAADGREATYETATPAGLLSKPMTATTSGGALLIDGRLFFPTMVWGQCADGYATSLAAGINLFLHDPCEATADAAERLRGHAFAVPDAFHANGDAEDVNLIGSYLPDEWDTFLPGDLTAEAVAKMVPADAPSPRFLTLTNHFFSRADPLPQGRGLYAPLIQAADVIGFDLYPLQNWCRSDAFDAVFDAQRELVALAAGRPTYQWIEARVMDCKPEFAVTPQTLRAETWLALAGGAHGIGYFPYSWTPDVGAEIAAERRELDTLAPALLEPPAEGHAADNAVKLGVREHNGALYVIAVNSAISARTTVVTVPAAADREFTTLDGSHTLTATGGVFTDTFGPLDVHVYVAPPSA